MQLDKNMIVDLLREHGDHQSADQVERELPDQVDTDQQTSLLERFGLDAKELASRFTGGSGLPGI